MNRIILMLGLLTTPFGPDATEAPYLPASKRIMASLGRYDMAPRQALPTYEIRYFNDYPNPFLTLPITPVCEGVEIPPVVSQVNPTRALFIELLNETPKVCQADIAAHIASLPGPSLNEWEAGVGRCLDGVCRETYRARFCFGIPALLGADQAPTCQEAGDRILLWIILCYYYGMCEG